MLNYGGCTLKTLGVGIVYVEYLFLNSSCSKKKPQFLTQILISAMVRLNNKIGAKSEKVIKENRIGMKKT